MIHIRSKPTAGTTVLAAGLLTALGLGAGGCQIPQLIGGMLQSYEYTGESMVFAEYDGLRDHTWAVVVTAPRSIRSEYPKIITVLSNAISGQIAGANDLIAAEAFLPGPVVLQFQLNTPAWEAWSYGEVAEELGVDRLIVVDIFEYQLFEPGNQYVWDGRVGARVGVVEAGPGADEFAFSKDMMVGYPDGGGYTPRDLSAGNVSANLQQRLRDRVAWLFFDHEEKNALKY